MSEKTIAEHVEELKKIVAATSLVDYKVSRDIRIVVLQRGNVMVGDYYQSGNQCEIRNGYVVRKWGTTDGLGQLAMEGKQEDTILDKVPLVKFHELTVIFTLDCNMEKWNDLIR